MKEVLGPLFVALSVCIAKNMDRLKREITPPKPLGSRSPTGGFRFITYIALSVG